MCFEKEGLDTQDYLQKGTVVCNFNIAIFEILKQKTPIIFFTKLATVTLVLMPGPQLPVVLGFLVPRLPGCI